MFLASLHDPLAATRAEPEQVSAARLEVATALDQRAADLAGGPLAKRVALFVLADAQRNHGKALETYANSLSRSVVAHRARAVVRLRRQTGAPWSEARELVRRTGAQCLGLCCSQGAAGALSLYVAGDLDERTPLYVVSDSSADGADKEQLLQGFFGALRAVANEPTLALPLWSLASNDAAAFVEFACDHGRARRSSGAARQERRHVRIRPYVADSMLRNLAAAAAKLDKSDENVARLRCLVDAEVARAHDVSFAREDDTDDNDDDDGAAWTDEDWHNITFGPAHGHRASHMCALIGGASAAPGAANSLCISASDLLLPRAATVEVPLPPIGEYALRHIGVRGSLSVVHPAVDTAAQRAKFGDYAGNAHTSDHVAKLELTALTSYIGGALSAYMVRPDALRSAARRLGACASGCCGVFAHRLEWLVDPFKLVLFGQNDGALVDVEWCRSSLLASDAVLDYVHRRTAVLGDNECASRVALTAVLHNAAIALLLHVFGVAVPSSVVLDAEFGAPLDEADVLDRVLELVEAEQGLWAARFANDVPVPLGVPALCAKMLQLRTLEMRPVDRLGELREDVRRTLDENFATVVAETLNLRSPYTGSGALPAECCRRAQLNGLQDTFQARAALLNACVVGDDNVGVLTSAQTLYVRSRIERLVEMGELGDADTRAELLARARPSTLDAVANMLARNNWASADAGRRVRNTSGRTAVLVLDAKFAGESGWGNGVNLTVASDTLLEYGAHQVALFGFCGPHNCMLELKAPRGKRVPCDACVEKGLAPARGECLLSKRHDSAALMALAFYFQRGATAPFIIGPMLLAALDSRFSVAQMSAWRTATQPGLARSIVARNADSASVYSECGPLLGVKFEAEFANVLSRIGACTPRFVFEGAREHFGAHLPIAQMSQRVNAMRPVAVWRALKSDSAFGAAGVLLRRAVLTSMLVFDRGDMPVDEQLTELQLRTGAIDSYIRGALWLGAEPCDMRSVAADGADAMSIEFTDRWRELMALRARAARREARECGDATVVLGGVDEQLAEAFSSMSAIAARQRAVYHVLRHIATSSADEIDEMYELLTGEKRLPALALMRASAHASALADKYNALMTALISAKAVYRQSAEDDYADYWAPTVRWAAEPTRAHAAFVQEARALLHHAIYVHTRHSVYPIVPKLQRPSAVSTCGRTWTLSPWTTYEQYRSDYALLAASKNVFLRQ